ncbi:DUF1178 family protein [Paracoccus seriniphilus]|uniref:DUF1178 family protein n=1 Tax=Paracoccus seriniphilus TaxID=184748 RepID=A0A239PX79_9RHOB|nr:DUF1178 family protein [Paracoccus seriniphilus]WCR13159.1 DUF1178 family protein [Paracoccus seriniphilus]SNT74546.1 hypothetical protein SAMN05444959_10841 [Paracoccus seriniphilus]
MIRYDLRCENNHEFDGWFRSSDSFEKMLAAGQISCAQCGSTKIEKALMSPSVSKDSARADKTAPPSLTQPDNPAAAALEKLRRHIEANSDYVGNKFVDEARAMHEGRSPSRAIHGEARAEDARKLLEDGVPVAPLPFIPRQKAN